jgi:hypothetical protein
MPERKKRPRRKAAATTPLRLETRCGLPTRHRRCLCRSGMFYQPRHDKICRLERAREEGEIRIAEDAMLAERAMLRGCEARSMRE